MESKNPHFFFMALLLKQPTPGVFVGAACRWWLLRKRRSNSKNSWAMFGPRDCRQVKGFFSPKKATLEVAPVFVVEQYKTGPRIQV